MREQHPSLPEYGAMIRRRWWLVVAATLAAALLAVLWSLTVTPQYESTVSVLVDTDSSADIFDPVSGQSRGARAMSNEALFAESFQVRTLAIGELQALGFADDVTTVTITASEVNNADVLKLRAVALSPDEAAAAAQTFATSYITLRRDSVVLDYLETARVIQESFDATQARLDALDGAETSESRILESQLEAFGTALSQLDVSAELGGATARIIEPATVPNAPFAPRTSRNVSFAIVLGALLGIAAALVVDAFDTGISSKEDLEVASGGLPNLAVIPSVRDWKDKSTSRIVSLERPASPEAESYRMLRASLEFATMDSDARILQITSANPGEGKTTTAINLAVAMARSGKRVILLDADLRKPRVHEFFALPLEPGFTSFVLGSCKFDEACTRVERDVGQLGILSSGRLPPGPSEFLGTQRTAERIANLADRCDVLLIDSAPVLPVSDALVLSSVVDATILVANGGRTSQPEFAEAVDRLRQVDARVLGTVLNQVRRAARNGYGYGYGYGYGDGDGDGDGDGYTA